MIALSAISTAGYVWVSVKCLFPLFPETTRGGSHSLPHQVDLGEGRTRLGGLARAELARLQTTRNSPSQLLGFLTCAVATLTSACSLAVLSSQPSSPMSPAGEV